MSALCQKRTSAASLDHLVGARNHRLGHGDTERLGGSLVDYQLDCRGLLDWQICRFFALKNPPGVTADSPKTSGKACPVAKKATCNSKFTKLVGGRNRVANRKCC